MDFSDNLLRIKRGKQIWSKSWRRIFLVRFLGQFASNKEMETNLKQILTKNISWIDFLDYLFRIKKGKQILSKSWRKIFLGWISWIIVSVKQWKQIQANLETKVLIALCLFSKQWKWWKCGENLANWSIVCIFAINIIKKHEYGSN